MIVQIKIGHKKNVCIFSLEDGADRRLGLTEPSYISFYAKITPNYGQ